MEREDAKRIMIRRCAVFGCDNIEPNDDAIRLIQFPDNKEDALKWKNSLQLEEFPIELLQTRFGVCDLHFSDEDFDEYKENDLINNGRQLKAKAVPTLRLRQEEINDAMGSSLAVSDTNGTDSIRIMAPTNANIALLQPNSKLYRTRSMEFSTASTGGNTDISILRTHDSHYGDDEHDPDDDDDDGFDEEHAATYHRRENYFSDRLQNSIDAPDFTVVSCPLEESTEVLHFHTIKPPSRNGYSGTDSDIEVLMSEEINDTEWSAALENLENNALELQNKEDCSIEAITANSQEFHDTAASPSVKQPDATDHDFSEEELSHETSFDGTGLSRDQLITLVREQKVRIQELESTLIRYRSAQQALFDQVDALRLEFAKSASMDLDKTHVTLG